MAKAKNQNVEAYQKVLNDYLLSGYQSEQEGPYADLFSQSMVSYGNVALLMKMDESMLALNNVAAIPDNTGAMIHELHMIANLAVMGIMELEKLEQLFEPGDDEDGEPDEADSDDPALELEELTKAELMQVANKCGVTGVNKKQAKDLLIKKIIDGAESDAEIYEAIDSIGDDDEK